MMTFSEFNKELQLNFREMMALSPYQYEMDIDPDLLWETYLNSFPEWKNPVFRTKTEHDCSCCRHFIKKYGNLAFICGDKLVSLWDFAVIDEGYNEVLRAMSRLIHSGKIKEYFVTDEIELGTEKTMAFNKKTGFVDTFNHFHLNYEMNPSLSRMVSIKGTTERLKSLMRDNRNVFLRSINEIKAGAVNRVIDLIEEGQIYRGSEFLERITGFRNIQKKYESLTEKTKETMSWRDAAISGFAVIRNTAIGTLLVNLSEGMDEEEAIRSFEHIMAPQNYKRPKPIITSRMIESAEKAIVEAGLAKALERRYATIQDIAVSDILHINRQPIKVMEPSIFEKLKKEVYIVPDNFHDSVQMEEITAEKFFEKILGTSKSVEVLFEKKHEKNLVSLIAPQHQNQPSLFKWKNNFSWSYKGNTADSIRENVQKAGGKIDGVLRFSIQWNDVDFNPNDYDAHCTEPFGEEIFWGHKHSDRTGGNLDVDITWPREGTVAVENITFPNSKKMEKGRYLFYVHNFTHNGGTSGFKAEIQMQDKIFEFECRHDLPNRKTVMVAEVFYDPKSEEKFSINPLIKTNERSASSYETWGIRTRNFHKASVIMASPNYWEGENKSGNKHYFFFLENCISDEPARPFYNEFLNEELLQHKRTFEVLGAKLKIESQNNQLSGLGFSSTNRDELIVKVQNDQTKIYKIIF